MEWDDTNSVLVVNENLYKKDRIYIATVWVCVAAELEQYVIQNLLYSNTIAVYSFSCICSYVCSGQEYEWKGSEAHNQVQHCSDSIL